MAQSANAMWYNSPGPGTLVSYGLIWLVIKTAQNSSNISAHGSSVQTKAVAQVNKCYNKKSKHYNIQDDMKAYYQALIGKPITLASRTFKTTDVVDQKWAYYLPTDLILINETVRAPFYRSALYNISGRVVVHMTGTPTHSGIVLVAAMPATKLGYISANSMLSAPHAFLYANQASSVEIEVPFYNASKYRRTPGDAGFVVDDYVGQGDEFDHSDYAMIVMAVWEPLVTGGTASTEITITPEFICDNIEFAVPINREAQYAPPAPVPPEFLNTASTLRGDAQSASITKFFDTTFGAFKALTGDLIDAGRGVLREWTGLHNRNISTIQHHSYVRRRINPNTTDAEVAIEKLTPFDTYRRFTDDYYFQTDCDEMDIGHLMAKPQYVDSFVVDKADERGRLLFSRPIVPHMAVDTTNGLFDSIHTKLAYCSQAWSGDMELIIQSSMTNFQQCKLLVVLDYGCDAVALNNVPKMNSVLGYPSYVLEFGGGGCVQTVDMPYHNVAAHCPIVYDYQTTALSHGIVYVYLLDPLTKSDATPNVAYFDVMLKCKPNFRLYGAGVNGFSSKQPLGSSSTLKGEAQSGSLSELVSNVDQSAAQLTAEEESERLRETEPPPVGGLRPNVNIRDILRRQYCVFAQYMNQTSTNTSFDFGVAGMLFSPEADGYMSPLTVIHNLYYGFRGGVRFKVVIQGAVNASAQYIPPAGMFMGGEATESYNFTAAPYQPVLKEATDDRTAMLTDLSLLPYLNMDAANYTNSASAFPVKAGCGTGPSVTRGSSTTILEFEIPFQSVFDMVVNKTISEDRPGAASSLGMVRLSVIPNNPAIQLNNSPYCFRIYASIDDDARYGFQCLSPRIYPPCVLVGEDTAILTLHGSPYRTITTVPHAEAPGAYYTRASV